jgi:uncharacterized protein (TIGR03435 family)
MSEKERSTSPAGRTSSFQVQMPKLRLFISIASLTVSSAMSQDRSLAPKFDVTSVKECKSGEAVPPSHSSPGRLSLGCWNLRTAIQQAYEVFASGKADPLNPLAQVIPIEGLPDWVASARYSIDAMAEHPESAAMMRGPMMQALLEDRFHLKVHRESRPSPVYLMTVAKSGLKLKPTKDGSCLPFDFSEGLNFTGGGQVWCALPRVKNGSVTVLDIVGVQLSVFAKLLHPDGNPVIDRTGVTGAFDIHMEWSEEQREPAAGAATDPSPHMSAIIATRQQLGLELSPAKGARDVLVIDRLERPTGN